MTNIKEHLGSTERVEYRFRPSRKAYLWEYLLFIFMMLLTFTSLYPLIMSQFKNIAIVGIIARVLFYILLTISIVLLVKVEYKIWCKLYVLTNHRIMISQGIFTEKFTSVTHGKITDVALEQTFWDKVLNIGKITIETAGSENKNEILENISRPIFVKKKISDLQTTGTSIPTHNPIHHMHKN